VKRLTCIVLAVCIPALAADEAKKKSDEPNAMDILKRVDAATKKVKAVQYEVEFEGTGGVKPLVAKFDAKYLFRGLDERMPKEFAVEMRGTMPGSSDTFHKTAGADGENYFLIDHATKKIYEDMDFEVLGSGGRIVQRAAMIEFVHEAPFSDELSGDKQELVGSKTIHGEECWEVRVIYKDNQGEALWCFSKKDYLPRSRHDVVRSPQGGLLKTIKNLTADPKIKPGAFKLQVPEGYQKIEDFAP
jgi:hypothetical protein